MMFSSGLNCNLSFPSCLGYPQDSEELIPKMAREPIILNVYDMVSCYFQYITNKVCIIINCLLMARKYEENIKRMEDSRWVKNYWKEKVKKKWKE